MQEVTATVAQCGMPFALTLAWATSEAGTICILKPLDFESKQRYNTTAHARDRSQRSWTSRSHVIIDVTDVNETLHAPVFCDFVVPEVGVMHVTATGPGANKPTAIPGDYMLAYLKRP